MLTLRVILQDPGQFQLQAFVVMRLGAVEFGTVLYRDFKQCPDDHRA
nr:hypothetical protein [Pseudomonas syringae pv. actinidiae]